jgi:flavin-binding protein dodecin
LGSGIGLKVPRQQLADTIDGVIGDSGQHHSQVRLWITVVRSSGVAGIASFSSRRSSAASAASADAYAENAVAEAAKTVRSVKWARVAELELELDGMKIVKYRAANATTKIYFDIEK